MKRKDDSDDEVTRCVCGTSESIGTMIQCETCSVWQHCECVNLGKKLPNLFVTKKREGGRRNTMNSRISDFDAMLEEPTIEKKRRRRTSDKEEEKERESPEKQESLKENEEEKEEKKDTAKASKRKKKDIQEILKKVQYMMEYFDYDDNVECDADEWELRNDIHDCPVNEMQIKVYSALKRFGDRFAEMV
ncbi:Histone-Lysine N-Methyltransferase ash1l [Boothiomyces sp. JEL0838]|nr:Histone-Lysine N-Methyltransferase ash1l [Boothiomyces sp. JEL0838]